LALFASFEEQVYECALVQCAAAYDQVGTKISSKIPNNNVSPETQFSVRCKRQYNPAGREVQVPWVAFTSDGRRNRKIEALIGRAKRSSAKDLLLRGDQVEVFKHRSC